MSRAFSMIGTATASLCGFSRAACPPKLKMPTLYPVFPRFRVGMEFVVAELNGRDPAAATACPRATSGIAADPSAAAVTSPPALRNVRRLLLDDLSNLFLLMKTSCFLTPLH